MEKIYKWLKSILVLLIFLPLRTTETETIQYSHNSHSIDLPFNYIYLTLYLENYGFGKAEIAQAILETGWFQSNIFCENNNLFGMKLPKKRHTTACGESRGHAKYSSWIESVNDYIIYRNANTKMNGYAKDLLYFKKISMIEKSL